MSRAPTPRSPSKAAPKASSSAVSKPSAKAGITKNAPEKTASSKKSSTAAEAAGKARPSPSPSLSPSRPPEATQQVNQPQINPQRATPAMAINILDGASPDPGYFSNDEVFDEVDQAQYLQLMEQAAIAERAKTINQRETHPDFDGKHCVECDAIIPVPRLKHGKVRCVDCQADIEDAARRKALMTAK
jgi:RNA polymerase-binding transcription factor DksA